MNSQASALRFFLAITLGRADLAHQLARTHYPRKLPRVLAAKQVARLIEAAPGPGLKYKTALSIPSLKAFGRRPRCAWLGSSWGRHPKPSTRPVAVAAEAYRLLSITTADLRWTHGNGRVAP